MNDKIIGRPIRLNQKTLLVKSGKDYAEMLFIGDVHYGSPQCDVSRFLRMLEYCSKNNLAVLLMGDLLEMSTRDSVGAGIYEQDVKAHTQFEQMVEWLKPLAKKNLLLGLHSGNHENRVYKSTGVNISKAMANELGVSFLSDACWNLFRVGSQRYTCYSLHGATNSRFDGTALLAAERISASFDCDILAHAHTHKSANASVVIQSVVKNSVKEYKKHLILTGGFVRYDGGYGQTSGMPISKLGSPKVKLFSSRHDVSISW